MVNSVNLKIQNIYDQESLNIGNCKMVNIFIVDYQSGSVQVLYKHVFRNSGPRKNAYIIPEWRFVQVSVIFCI